MGVPGSASVTYIGKAPQRSPQLPNHTTNPSIEDFEHFDLKVPDFLTSAQNLIQENHEANSVVFYYSVPDKTKYSRDQILTVKISPIGANVRDAHSFERDKHRIRAFLGNLREFSERFHVMISVSKDSPKGILLIFRHNKS